MSVPAEFTTGLPDWPDTPPIALITGAAQRIGAAFARALAADGFGVAVHCHHSARQAEDLSTEIAAAGHPRPLVVQADLALPDAADKLFAQLPRPPAILVNNAALFVEDSLHAIDPLLWEQHFAINLRAPALLTSAMAQRLEPGRHGLVVNLLDAKLAAVNPDHFSYTLSKYGLAGLTEMSARALAPRIRVNAIAPAITLISGPQTQANFARAHRHNPLRRGLSPDDLVRALRYIVQTPTVTGQTLTIDAGQRFLALPRDVAYMAAP